MSDFSGVSLGDLLRLLRQSDSQFRVFGSKQHRYRTGAVLSEQQLLAFESANQVVLPEDYRLFLRTVGNGGAGPYYGLQRLDTLGCDLSRPFPLTKTTEGLKTEEMEQIGDWDELPGILELCHQGCAIYFYLVVKGPTYGSIWIGREDFYPTGLSFDTWFRQWAERAIRSLRNQPVANRLKIGMTKSEVVSLVPSDWNARQAYDQSVWYFEAPDVPVQLELDENDIVTKLNPRPFI